MVDWNLVKLKMQQTPSFIVSPYSNLESSKTTGLNFFIKVSIDNFLSSKMGSHRKIIGCLFSQSFLRRFDGKYRSATAPLVYSLC